MYAIYLTYKIYNAPFPQSHDMNFLFTYIHIAQQPELTQLTRH
jgi:alanine dehydrogenase